MNRRLFMLGTAAMSPSVVAGQATPGASSGVDAAEVLRAYVSRVFNDQDLLAVPELFSSEGTNVYEEYRQHADLVETLDSGYRQPFRLIEVAATGAIAMGFGWLYLEGAGKQDAFILIAVDQNGLILRRRLVWVPSE